MTCSCRSTHFLFVFLIPYTCFVHVLNYYWRTSFSLRLASPRALFCTVTQTHAHLLSTWFFRRAKQEPEPSDHFTAEVLVNLPKSKKNCFLFLLNASVYWTIIAVNRVFCCCCCYTNIHAPVDCRWIQFILSQFIWCITNCANNMREKKVSNANF